MHEKSSLKCRGRDHTARLWDVASQRCRQTFRGHVDSVNAIAWQPFTNNLCTGSGDKTVSLWDARSGLCMQVRTIRWRKGDGDSPPEGKSCCSNDCQTIPSATLSNLVTLSLRIFAFGTTDRLARPSTDTRTRSTTYAAVFGAIW